MMRLNLFCVCKLLFVTALLLPNKSVADTLADAMANAYKNSDLLESRRALLRVSNEKVPQALAAMRPKVNAQTSATANVRSGYFRTGLSPARTRTEQSSLPLTLQIGAELTIYDGGDTKIATEAAHEGVLAVRQSLIEAEQGVLLGAARAYFAVLRQRKLLELANNGLEFFSAQLDAAESRNQLGEITKTDVSLVESQLAGAQGNLHTREGELEIAEKTYLFQVGKLPGALESSTPLPEIPKNLEQAKMIATKQHPTIKRSQHTVASARLNLKRFETINKPRIKLGGGFGTNREYDEFSRGTDTFSVSLSATMPIYQGGVASSRLRETAANAEKAAIDLHFEAKKISHGVVVAWNRLEITQLLIPTIQQQVGSARLAVLGIREELTLGTRTTLDLLRALQDLSKANTDLVSAKTERDVAVYELLAAMGLMTVEHLGLDVPIYNPETSFNEVKDAPAVRKRQELINKILERSSRTN